MQPFELPEFYMPYPARLNPNLESAREHSKAWAYEMDMVDAPQNGTAIWDEHDFDSHDYALLCAYTHPDAPGPELDLVTDWYVWVFYFDDHFLELYKRTRDLAGAREYLDRLRAFMPVEGVITETPTNPVERGLSDLDPHRPEHVHGLAAPVRRKHQEPPRRVPVGTRQHQTRAVFPTPSNTSRCGARSAAPPGRPTSSNTPQAPRSRPRSPPPGRCRCSGTPSPTGCTGAPSTTDRPQRRPATAMWSHFAIRSQHPAIRTGAPEGSARISDQGQSGLAPPLPPRYVRGSGADSRVRTCLHQVRQPGQ